MISDLFDIEKITDILNNVTIYIFNLICFNDQSENFLSFINHSASGLTLNISYGLLALLILIYILKITTYNYKTIGLGIICLMFCYGLENFIKVQQLQHDWYPSLAVLKLFNTVFLWLIIIYCITLLPSFKRNAVHLESHKLFKAILAKIPTAVILLDESLHIIQINPAVETLFGRQSKDLLNIRIFNLFCTTSCQHLKNFFNGKINNLPHVLTAVLGALVQSKEVSITVQYVEDVDQGKYLMTLIDVTQAEQARIAINQRQQEVETILAYKQAIFYNMQDGVITLTNDGAIERMNPKAEEILGFKFIDMKGRDISEVMIQATHLPQDTIREKIAGAERHLKKHNLHIMQEYIIGSSHSDVKTVEFIISIMHVKDEKRYCLILHDITARKKYEQELKSHEQLLNQITDNIDAMIWIADPVSKKIIYRSRSFYHLFKSHSIKEFENESINHCYIHPDDLNILNHDLFQEGPKGPWRQIIRIIRADGQLRYFSINSINITNIDNKISKLAGIIFDITEMVEAKKAVEQQKDELSQHCNELNNRNDKLDTFAHIIAHDLKAPLFAISNLSSWLKEDCSHLLPAQSHEHLELLLKRAQGMNSLLDDIFDYFFKSTIKGKSEKHIWKNFIDDILHSIQIPGGLRIIDETGLDIIYTNKILLRQVFSNLISNAVKYHHQPERGHVYIGCDETDQYYHFSIADDGPGIAQRFFDDIFKPLTKLQSRDEVEGSGMGLAIVKKIVMQQGGEIFIDSSEGQGAKFTFTWPKLD